MLNPVPDFDIVRDIAPIGGIDRNPQVLVVHPSLPVNSVPELIAYAKAHPGELNMASGGVGSTPHLAGELFKMMTGVNMLHVPYRGDAPAITDLLEGQVQVMFDQVILSIDHIRAGRLKALAVSEHRQARRAARSAAGVAIRAGLRGLCLARHRRAEEHAARNPRSRRQGNQRRARRREDAEAPLRSRRRADAEIAGRVWSRSSPTRPTKWAKVIKFANIKAG